MTKSDSTDGKEQASHIEWFCVVRMNEQKALDITLHFFLYIIVEHNQVNWAISSRFKLIQRAQL